MDNFDLHDLYNIVNDDKPTKVIVNDVLNSSIPNIVQTRVVNAVERKIASVINNKKNKIPFFVNVKLNQEQENFIIDNYPEFDLTFNSNTVQSHGTAAVCRDLSNTLLLQKAGYNVIDNTGFDLIKDIGGNFYRNFVNSRNVHSCCPIIDAYDSHRLMMRCHMLEKYLKNTPGINQKSWKSFMDIKGVVTGSLKESNIMCLDTFQNCTLHADVVISQDSIYDISGRDFAHGMVNSKAKVAYASFIFDPVILTKQSGRIEGLGMYYRYRDDKVPSLERQNIDSTGALTSYSNPIDYSMDPKYIEFGFENDNGFVYKHSVTTYLSWVLNTVISYDDSRFLVEMMENRSGYQFIRISPLFSPNLVVPDHRIWFKHHQNKYLINVYDFSYTLLNSGAKISPSLKGFLQDVSGSCTYNVPILVDKELVDRCRDFASTVSTKFTPDEILAFAKSVNTNRPQGNVINRFRGELNSYELRCVALAVYITVFDEKWRMGKINKQMLYDITDLRDLLGSSVWSKLWRYLFGNNNQLNQKSDSFLKIFNNPFTGWLDKKLYERMVNKKMALNLITSPPLFLRVHGGSVKKISMSSTTLDFDPDDYMFKGYGALLDRLVNDKCNMDSTRIPIDDLPHDVHPVKERFFTQEDSNTCSMIWGMRNSIDLRTNFAPDNDSVIVTDSCDLSYGSYNYYVYCKDYTTDARVTKINGKFVGDYVDDNNIVLISSLYPKLPKFHYYDVASIIGFKTIDSIRGVYAWLNSFLTKFEPDTLLIRFILRDKLEYFGLVKLLSKFGILSKPRIDIQTDSLYPIFFVTAENYGKRPCNLKIVCDEILNLSRIVLGPNVIKPSIEEERPYSVSYDDSDCDECSEATIDMDLSDSEINSTACDSLSVNSFESEPRYDLRVDAGGKVSVRPMQVTLIDGKRVVNMNILKPLTPGFDDRSGIVCQPDVFYYDLIGEFAQEDVILDPPFQFSDEFSSIDYLCEPPTQFVDALSVSHQNSEQFSIVDCRTGAEDYLGEPLYSLSNLSLSSIDSVLDYTEKPSVMNVLRDVYMTTVDMVKNYSSKVLNIIGDGNCCIRSVTEGKTIDVKTLKKNLSTIDEYDSDLQKECEMGVFGGTAIIAAFAKYSYTDVVLIDENEGKTYCISAMDNSIRTVTVRYRDMHYDHVMNDCYGTTDVQTELFYVRPPDPILFTSDGFSRSDTLAVIYEEISGKLFLNNLCFNCGRHKECSNMGVDYILSNIKLAEKAVLRLIVENKNFKPKPSKSFNINTIPLGEHTILEISNITNHKKRNLVIEIDKGSATTYKRRDQKLELILSSDGLKDFERKILPYLTGYDTFSVYSRVVEVGKFFRSRNDTQYSYIGDVNDFDYVSEVDEKSRRLNAMIEVRSLWRNSVNDVVKNIKPYYDNAIKFAGDECKLNFLDASFGLIDLKTKTWRIKPKLIYKEYNNCYADKIYECAIKSEGKDLKILSSDVHNDIRYVAVSKDTRLIVGNKLYDAVKYYDTETIHFPNEVVMVQGAPGVGKTSWILNNHLHKGYSDIVVTTTREGATDLRDRAKRMFSISDENFLRLKYRTGDSLLINYRKDIATYDSVDRLFIDEGLMKHCGEWYWYCHVLKVKTVIIVGDMAQIPYIDRTGRDVKYAYHSGVQDETKYLSHSYRCPLDVVAWLNLKDIGVRYPFKVTGSSLVKRSVECRDIAGVASVSNEPDTVYLVFNQEEKIELSKWLRGCEVYTVHEFQGKQSKRISLVRMIAKPYPVFDSPEHILVALTRHTEKFVYYSVKRDRMYECVRQIMDYYDCILTKYIVDKRKTGGCIVQNNFKLVHEKANNDFYGKLVDLIVSDYGESSYVPLRWYPIDDEEEKKIVQLDCKYDYIPAIPVLQDFVDYFQPGSSIVDTKYDQYLLDIQKFEEYSPLLYLRQSFDNSIPIPVHYVFPNLRTSVKEVVIPTQLEVTKAYFERNGNIPELDVSVDRSGLVEKMLKNFKTAYVREDSYSIYDSYVESPVTVNKQSIRDWLYTQHNSVERALKTILKDKDIFHTRFDFNTFEYILKKIPKLDLEVGAETRNKSPQTIAFQPKDFNVIFCPIVREIKRRLLAVLKPNVLIYSDMSLDDFEKILTKVFDSAKFQRLKEFLEIDFSKYDKSQGLLAFEFEIEMLKLLGVDPLLIEYWIFIHVESYLLNRSASFYAKTFYQRKSGDAMTFFGNTIFLMAVLAFCLDLTLEDLIMLFSGDDFLIFSRRKIKIRMHMFPNIFNLEAKVLNYDVPYFCSKFLIFDGVKWNFIPDPLKLVVKLGRKDLKNEQHISDYFASFVDLVRPFNNVDMYDQLSYGLSQRYGVVNVDFSYVFQTLLYLAVNKSEFEALYTLNPDEKFVGSILPSLDI